MIRNFRLGFLLFLASTQSGCSLLLGSIKPIDDKSSTYASFDLSKLHEWHKLDAKNNMNNPGDSAYNTDAGGSDVAYQSNQTRSIISLNSVCKNFINIKQDLSKLTSELLLGMSNITLNSEIPLTVSNQPALQTTLTGTLNHETVSIRTVVLRYNNCVYDLMYISKPDRFSIDEGDFDRFVSSFTIKTL